MLPGMKFYIVSIVSIFAALGIGIYIGFAMDSQDFMIQQKEGLTEMLEAQFEILISENQDLKNNEKKLEQENKYKEEYIESSYNFIINNRLKDVNVGIIETNSDYITSGIGRELELAGAKVVNLTTINSSIINKADLNTSITTIANSVINGVSQSDFEGLEGEGVIDFIGNYNEPIDYLIICGGSFEESSKRINQIDKIIINLGKKHNIPILGVEKSNVKHSYISEYKDLDISTVDNVDMTMGKVAMILSMEGVAGDYGIKSTAKRVIPIIERGIEE